MFQRGVVALEPESHSDHNKGPGKRKRIIRKAYNTF